MNGELTRTVVRALDRAAALLRQRDSTPPHLATGRRGEEAAYFYLRKLGYVMVARNWRSPRRPGELDLVGWDDGILCFIEVKTRSGRTLVPAEAAVDADKQDELCGVAREFLRRQPERTPTRGDVVSVYFDAAGGAPEITLFKNAFALR